MTDQARAAKILRAFYSAASAYPEAAFSFLVSEAAKQARVSVAVAEAIIDSADVYERYAS